MYLNKRLKTNMNNSVQICAQHRVIQRVAEIDKLVHFTGTNAQQLIHNLMLAAKPVVLVLWPSYHQIVLSLLTTTMLKERINVFSTVD